MKIFKLLLLMVPILFIIPSIHAIDIIYLDATDQSEPRFVTSAEDEDICRRRNRLTGLDKVRKILGLENCSGSVRTSDLTEEIDLLVLVNDVNRMHPDAVSSLDSVDGQLLTCSSGETTKRVFPNYFIFEDIDENSGVVPQDDEQNSVNGNLRTLVMGEAMIQSYFSEDSSLEPLQRYITSIIARANGTDNSPDSGVFSPSINSNASNNIPAGKGLFQTSAMHELVNNRYKPYKMDHMADNFHTNGLNWFAVSAIVASRCEGRLYTQYLRFGHPTFQLFIWMLNEPENLDEQVQRLMAAAKNIKANGIMVDIEGSFSGHAAQAHQIYLKARESARQFSESDNGWPISVGITLIPTRSGGAPSFINVEDLRDSDFIIPQIYNRKDMFTERQFRVRLDSWSPELAHKIIQGAGAHHCDPIVEIVNGRERDRCINDRAKTPEEFENTIRHFRDRGYQSIVWWRYGSIENGNHWQRIREFELN